MKIKLNNRYGYNVEVYQKNDEWYIRHDIPENEPVRVMMKTMTTYSLVDFVGGPLITDNSFFDKYNSALPKLSIDHISYDIFERAYKLHFVK